MIKKPLNDLKKMIYLLNYAMVQLRIDSSFPQNMKERK
jgi:hypothetical protein